MEPVDDERARLVLDSQPVTVLSVAADIWVLTLVTVCHVEESQSRNDCDSTIGTSVCVSVFVPHHYESMTVTAYAREPLQGQQP